MLRRVCKRSTIISRPLIETTQMWSYYLLEDHAQAEVEVVGVTSDTSAGEDTVVELLERAFRRLWVPSAWYITLGAGGAEEPFFAFHRDGLSISYTSAIS